MLDSVRLSAEMFVGVDFMQYVGKIGHKNGKMGAIKQGFSPVLMAQLL